MATASSPNASRPRADKSSASKGQDAIALLEADHAEVDGYFAQYEELTDPDEKKALADKICLALKVHAQIEEPVDLVGLVDGPYMHLQAVLVHPPDETRSHDFERTSADWHLGDLSRTDE